MEELRLQSSLTMEEVEDNFQNVDFFSGVMEGLQEALAHSQGRAAAETVERKRALPTVNVAELRTALSMTQKTFADLLGVSRRTVEAWESGRSTPTPTAKKLMFLIEKDHSIVQKLNK